MKLLTLFWRNWKWIFFCLYTVILVRLIHKFALNTTPKNLQGSENVSRQLSSWQGFSEKQIASMSNLGHMLYMGENPPKAIDANFTILVHKYGPFLERRHIKNFGDKRIDPFSACSVQNCRLTYDERDLPSADAVLVHLHRTCKLGDIPAQTGTRPPHQRWIFLTDESPKNAFLCGNRMNVRDLDGVFNWSMSYRYDADIPVPYGRTVKRQKPLEESVHKAEIEALLRDRKELAAILISNCRSTSLRWRYVSELTKHMPLEIIGGCGNKTICKGNKVHYGVDCPELRRFKFYLAFENTLCDQYVTEKLWWNAFHNGAVPVIMGGDASGKTYSQFLPPGSYLNVDDFKGPEDLAKCLEGDCATEERLRELHSWRKDFEVLQEHAYFGSPSVHYCRICEALNYNSRLPKIYNDFNDALKRDLCRADLRKPLRS